MARKPRAPKEKREPAHKMDGDGVELTAGDGEQNAAVESEIDAFLPAPENVCWQCLFSLSVLHDTWSDASSR